MHFRPCIDLHNGKVKQIVGSSLSDHDNPSLITNFETDRSPAYFAQMYKNDHLQGGHVIMLGPGNEKAAEAALAAYPDGLQVGGGIAADNAGRWLDCGAAKVIVTSYIFPDGDIDWSRLESLSNLTGRDKLVLDLSCRKKNNHYYVVTNRWQTFSSLAITPATLAKLADFCSEFLVHAVDMEGKQQGIEQELVTRLADGFPLAVTYAGGISNMYDIEQIKVSGKGRIDITVGSALDIFGGNGLRYCDLVKLDQNGFNINH